MGHRFGAGALSPPSGPSLFIIPTAKQLSFLKAVKESEECGKLPSGVSDKATAKTILTHFEVREILFMTLKQIYIVTQTSYEKALN